MPREERFQQMQVDMQQRRESAMRRAADLEEEVNQAIHDLKRRNFPESDVEALFKRFTEVEQLAGVKSDVVHELITGLKRMEEETAQKATPSAVASNFSASTAIRNLNRIIEERA